MALTVKQVYAEVLELRTDLNRVQDRLNGWAPLRAELRTAYDALNGDSNDAEHDALIGLSEAVANYIGMPPWTPANEI
jgi:hypothetical protein